MSQVNDDNQYLISLSFNRVRGQGDWNNNFYSADAHHLLTSHLPKATRLKRSELDTVLRMMINRHPNTDPQVWIVRGNQINRVTTSRTYTTNGLRIELGEERSDLKGLYLCSTPS